MNSNDGSSVDITENTGILTRSQRKKLLEQEPINNSPDDDLESSSEEDIELEEEPSVQSINQNMNNPFFPKQSPYPPRQNGPGLDGIIVDFLAKYLAHNINSKLQSGTLDNNMIDYPIDYDENLDSNGYYQDGFVVPDNYVEYNSDEDDDYDPNLEHEVEDLTTESDGYETDYEEEYIPNNRLNRVITPMYKTNMTTVDKENIQTCKQYMNIMKNYQRNTPETYFMKMKIDERKKIINQEQQISGKLMADIPLRFQILNSNLPDNVKALAIAKVNVIDNSESNGSDYYKIKEWLDGLLQIPFNKNVNMPVGLFSPPVHIQQFLQNSGNILNNAIYGQNDTKTHVIQIISQLISNPESIGNVFSIYGPMGTGKTSLVKKGIAQALGRPFTLISLGGMTDSSFFRGHSYTYEGSRPGRIVEILRDSHCMNPIIYFDELDKVSDTPKGEEIIHTLIHLTDKSQNMNFQDNYYSGVPLDLSKAIFIFSYNDENKINPILRDRMYKIPVKGFTINEKIKIAKDYLLADIYKNFNFNSSSIYFSDDILRHIINEYTKDEFGMMEDGVRNLERCLETIISKLNVLRLYHQNKVSGNSFVSGFQETSMVNNSLPHVNDINVIDDMDDEDLRIDIEKNTSPQVSYEYEIPFDIPELAFPLVMTSTILSKLLKAPKKDSPHLMMYC